MFSSFMINTWIATTIIAVVAGTVGFFVVLRGSAFAAHALPQGAFAGAAGAGMLGVDPVAGMAVMTLAGALGISWLERRARYDVAIALALVSMLALGALFSGVSDQYAPQLYSLLFGEILGISRSELPIIAALGLVAIVAIVVLWRPLLLTSMGAELGRARGVSTAGVETLFLLVVAAATTTAVPVVGALLMFSLLIAPAGTARSFTSSPVRAAGLSVVIALGIMWLSIAASYQWGWPIGFFVGVFGATAYAFGRGWAAWRRTKVSSVPAASGKPTSTLWGEAA